MMLSEASNLPNRWVHIHTAALKHNLRYLQSKAPTAHVMGVVKANAYGHGMPHVVPILHAGGVKHFGVATLFEAFETQKIAQAHGLSLDTLLILGALPAADYKTTIAEGFDFMLHTPEDIPRLAAHAKALSRPARLHLKIDTGMGRVGFLPHRLPEVLNLCQTHGEHLHIRGVCSHLSCADGLAGSEDAAHTRTQIQRFQHCRETCESHPLFQNKTPLYHLANSDGTLQYPDSHHDMVRPGIALYGYTGVVAERAHLRPTLSLHTQITQRRQVPAGTPIGYGRTFVTARESELGVIAMGYEDGLHRQLSNRFQAVVHGHTVPVVGRISMDQCMIDLTDLCAAGVSPEVGSQVTLLGPPSAISAQHWADTLDTIPYEMLTSLGQRLPRMVV